MDFSEFSGPSAGGVRRPPRRSHERSSLWCQVLWELSIPEAAVRHGGEQASGGRSARRHLHTERLAVVTQLPLRRSEKDFPGFPEPTSVAYREGRDNRHSRWRVALPRLPSYTRGIYSRLHKAVHASARDLSRSILLLHLA
jgi:hypothetical protein